MGVGSPDGSMPRRAEGTVFPVTLAKFSIEGKFIVTGASDVRSMSHRPHTIRVWDSPPATYPRTLGRARQVIPAQLVAGVTYTWSRVVSRFCGGRVYSWSLKPIDTYNSSYSCDTISGDIGDNSIDLWVTHFLKWHSGSEDEASRLNPSSCHADAHF